MWTGTDVSAKPKGKSWNCPRLPHANDLSYRESELCYGVVRESLNIAYPVTTEMWEWLQENAWACRFEFRPQARKTNTLTTPAIPKIRNYFMVTKRKMSPEQFMLMEVRKDVRVKGAPRLTNPFQQDFWERGLGWPEEEGDIQALIYAFFSHVFALQILHTYQRTWTQNSSIWPSSMIKVKIFYARVEFRAST